MTITSPSVAIPTTPSASNPAVEAAPSAPEPAAGAQSAPQQDGAAAAGFNAPANGTPTDIRNALPLAEPGVMSQLTPPTNNGPQAQPASTPNIRPAIMPPSQGLMMVNSNTNTVDTGSYTIHASKDDGGTLSVTDNTSGENFKISGESHIQTGDGDKTNFMRQPATFELPDGTKITVTPTEGEGPTYIDNVTITRGNDAAQINGVHDGNLHTVALRDEGRYLDNATPDGTLLQAKDGHIDDLVLADGTEVKGNSVQNIDGYANSVPSTTNSSTANSSTPAANAADSASDPGLDNASNRFVTKDGDYIDLNTNRLHYKNGIVTEPLSQKKLDWMMNGGWFVEDGSGQVPNPGLDKANNRLVINDGTYIDLNTKRWYGRNGIASNPVSQERINYLIAVAQHSVLEILKYNGYLTNTNPDTTAKSNANIPNAAGMDVVTPSLGVWGPSGG